MSRRFLFLLVITAVVVYFSIILYMLRPLHAVHSVHGDPLSLRFPSLNKFVIDWCQPLRWQNPPTKTTVVLASYPGSGNTWLRYLLQQATGIITGSVYFDQGLRLNGLPGEGVNNGSVLVVKTHELRFEHSAAILLIRNPRDAILAEYHRKWRGHIGTAPKTAFEIQDYKKSVGMKLGHQNLRFEWTKHVPNHLKSWQNFNEAWMRNFSGPLHIVMYEDLVNDIRGTLRGILDFLNVRVSEEQFECAISHKEGIYRRKHKLRNYDPFTLEMYERIEAVKSQVYALVEERKRKNYSPTLLRVIRSFIS